MNALHLEAHLELKEIWEDFRDDPEVWVAILTGAGERAFSAGNDLKVTAERTATGGDVQGAARPPFGRITRDFDCPKPMIAAVNGVAVGGGLEMALACDIIIAADHARLGLPEPRVGLIAGAGGIHRLARQVPFKLAMGLLLTGRLIDADEAYRIGLVNEVVPLAELMPTAERWAAEILECSPSSLRLTKEAVFDGLQAQRRRSARARPRPARAAARVRRLRRGPEGVRREAEARVDRDASRAAARGSARLRALLSPKSVALVGASDRSGWSTGVVRELRAARLRGSLHLVNRNGGVVHGRPAVTSCTRDRRARRSRAHARRRRRATGRARGRRGGGHSLARSCSPPASARQVGDGVDAQRRARRALSRARHHLRRPELPRLRQRRRPRAGVVGAAADCRSSPGAGRGRLAERSDRPHDRDVRRRRRTSASAT